MRKTFKFTFAMLALTAMVASCSEADLVPGGRLRRETITATVAEPADGMQTRTCVDIENTGHGYLGILWQENDSIGVYSAGGTTRNALFLSQTQGNAKKADFSGSMTGSDKPYRAYSPYSPENDGREMDDLRGILPAVQPFNPESGRLTGDYKYGAPVSGTRQFNFRSLFTLLRVSVDATDTPLAGDCLESIELTVTDPQGNERPICGGFTFSARDGSWHDVTGASGTVRMPWTTRPALTAGATSLGFITVMPVVKRGDRISVSVISGEYKTSFTATCQVDFQAEHVYNIPLTLNEYAKRKDEFGYEVVKLPTIKSFSFSAEKNPGRILGKKLVWDTGKKAPRFDNVSNQEAAIEGDTISLMIPYLYNFRLVPDFTASDGARVTVGGTVQESGKSEVDFSKPVTYTVTAGEESRNYVVSVTNTGLPVVVLSQSSSGDFSEKKVPSSSGIISSKVTSNKFVDFWVRGKDTEWVNDDRITVYNADGTVDVSDAACGIRLRGNTTQIYPKKPLAIKLDKKAAVLGMESHKRWVLLANWLDHSMIRNAVAFRLAHAMEDAWKLGAIEPGIPWNVHGQNVELVIDGHHVGNYYLCEQIKIDKKRLAIHDNYEDVLKDHNEKGKEAPTAENCGYLFELDNNYDETYQFKTSKMHIPFMFKDDVLTTEIVNKVQSKIQGIENNVNSGNFSAAYNDLDINTLVDQLLIWELTQNHEFTDPRSVYYFMDGINGKLCAGPVWDFDRATFQNVSRAESMGNSGDRLKPYDKWICLSTERKNNILVGYYIGGSIWYQKLMTDLTFQAKLQERWAVMYPRLQGVVPDIRKLGTDLARSYEVNSVMWPTTKEAIQASKDSFSDWSGDEDISAYPDVIENFVTVYRNRLEGMNALITSGRFTK